MGCGIFITEDLDWNQGPPLELKPGMIVEEEDGGRFLVGHINACHGGECDCCSRYSYEHYEAIVRWCQVIEIDNSRL